MTNFNSVPDNSSYEDASRAAERRMCLDESDILEAKGLRLGRYPFASAMEHYLQRRFGTVADSTYKEEERKLKYLGNVFENLRSEGKVRTTDPRHIQRHDIQAFMSWMRKKEIDPVAQAKYLQYLKGFLRCFKNHVLEDMEDDGVRFPRPTKKPIRTIALEDLRRIFSVIDGMPAWHGTVARGMTSLYLATGVRPKELRLAHREDLDVIRMRFFVRHPKGEGSWASPDWIDMIRPDMIPYIQRYLLEREDHLQKKGLKRATALFPNLYRSENEFYSANAFNEIKCKVEVLSGVDFKLKDFRSTLTTITINEDLSRLPAMSQQLRHAKIETTQRYYANIKQGVAGKQLKDAWKETPILTTQRGVIEKKFDNTGYW